MATAESAPKTAALVNNQVVVNDQFDRAWWRTAIALDRVGLGIVDKTVLLVIIMFIHCKHKWIIQILALFNVGLAASLLMLIRLRQTNVHG